MAVLDRRESVRKSWLACSEHWFVIIALMNSNNLRPAIPPDSKKRSGWKSVWRGVTISGGVLTLLGYGFNGLFLSSRTPLHLPVSCFAVSMICVLIGIACLSIGEVGWALLLGRSGRGRITAFGFAFPVALAFIGYCSPGGHTFGSFPIFYLPLFPLIFVEFILVWIW
jgi:hypothetical protein